MHSLKHQILIILLGSLVLLAASFLTALGYYMKDRSEAAAIIKIKADLATCEEIIDKTYPGSWSELNGNLYKGSVKISLNNDLVDHLSNLTGDTVTFFLGETRVATTVLGSNGERATGTKVADNVAQTVLQNGQSYIGEANVVGQLFQTGYVPLHAENGSIIGIFYVGISHTYEQEIITQSLIRMAEIGLALTVLVALLTWILLQKVLIYPLHTIMLGTREVAAGNLTQKIKNSGAKEIGELEGAFNQMVEQIQFLTGEISRVNAFNRGKSLSTGELNSSIEVKESEAMTELPFKNTFAAVNETHSGFVNDAYIGDGGLPKGLNQATLDQIVQFLKGNRRPLSAEEVAEGVKLTRVTVRRYLEFLEHCGALKSEQKYGTVGRPVKLFIPI